MELISSLKTAVYIKRLFAGETDNILPFPVQVQKPRLASHSPCALPRCTVRQAGYTDDFIIQHLLRPLSEDALGGAQKLMLAKDGKVFFASQFAPYTHDAWNITHSLCKSFTGTAIGLLTDEGKISVEDKVCSFFPEKCSLLTNKRMRSITVKHLLTMTSGCNFKEPGCVLERDWIKGFFDADMLFEPGSRFDYNSMNSYMLSAIIQKVTGQTLTEYLKPRLFEPLGFGDVLWEKCPHGIEKGGWGMYVHPEDALKLGLLYLQNGVWYAADGTHKQILSTQWVADATAVQAVPDTTQMCYGYQIWVHPTDGSFAFNGLFGQYVLAFPQSGVAAVVNSCNECTFVESRTYDTLYAAFSKPFTAPKQNIFRRKSAQRRLQNAAASLVFRCPLPQKIRRPHSYNTPLSDTQKAMLRRCSFTVQSNHVSVLPVIMQVMNDYYSDGIERVWVTENENGAVFHWTESQVEYAFPFGLQQYQSGELNFNGNIFSCAAKGALVPNEDNETVLKIELCFLEYSSVRNIKCVFHQDGGMAFKMTESPAVMSSMQTALQTTPIAAKLNASSLKDLDYVEFQVNKLFTPVLACKPAASAGSADTEP